MIDIIPGDLVTNDADARVLSSHLETVDHDRVTSSWGFVQSQSPWIVVSHFDVIDLRLENGRRFVVYLYVVSPDAVGWYAIARAHEHNITHLVARP